MLLAAAALLVGPVVGAPARAEPTRPSIVVIVTDDQRSDELDGMPIVKSQLMERGVTFTNGFVVNPICCPSRASILTGEYSHTSGVYRQIPPHGRFEALRDDSTIATWLDDAGYTTGLVGKYIDGYQHPALTGYVPPGWDHWTAFVHSGYYDYGLTRNGAVTQYGRDPSVYSTDLLASDAEAFIRSTQGPMFLYFAPAAPHAPAIPGPGLAGAAVATAPARPPSFDEADVSDKPASVQALPRLTAGQIAAETAFRANQERTLLSVDHAVGGILQALADTGRLQNTLIVYTSDNGILLGEHRWDKKEVPYDEAIRVPFIVRDDALGGPQGSIDARFALNVDIAPTVAAAAGVPAPRAEGVSLLPLVAGLDPPWRTDFLVEHMEGTNRVPTYCAVRSETSMYVRYQTGEEELYELGADPYELTNVATDPAHATELATDRRRVAELCTPPPPGLYGARSFGVTWMIVAVVALVFGGAAIAQRPKPR